MPFVAVMSLGGITDPAGEGRTGEDDTEVPAGLDVEHVVFKVHLRCERGGKPMVVVLTGDERHEQPVLPLLMECGAVRAGHWV